MSREIATSGYALLAMTRFLAGTQKLVNNNLHFHRKAAKHEKVCYLLCRGI